MPAGITPLRIITTLAVVVIALFIAAFAVWWFSLPRLDEQVDTIQRQISAESYITVFLVPDTSTDISQQLQQQIEGLPGVARVAFVSADQALAKFKERLKADPGAIDALNALGGANPLGAEIAVFATTIDANVAIYSSLQSLKADHSHMVDAIDHITHDVEGVAKLAQTVSDIKEAQHTRIESEAKSPALAFMYSILDRIFGRSLSF